MGCGQEAARLGAVLPATVPGMGREEGGGVPTSHPGLSCPSFPGTDFTAKLPGAGGEEAGSAGWALPRSAPPLPAGRGVYRPRELV